MQSFPVMFSVVRAMHKFDFRLVTNETASKWRPVDKRSRSDPETMFHVFNRNYRLSPYSRREC